jgi:transmembrane sensor
MLKQEEIEKIDRYFKGQADDSEKVWVESQFLNGEDNISLQHLLRDEWDTLLREYSSSGIDLNHLLDHIHHLIRKNESFQRQKPLQKIIRIYSRAAAILLLPLLLACGLIFGYIGNKGKVMLADQKVSSTIFAPLGARISFNLPDGTAGMLNSGSKLTYSLPFNQNRQVILEGEVWLEVTHNEEHPFEIVTGNSSVKVLGTSLNISAYPAENYVEVVLQKGKVEFLDSAGDIKTTLFPSERLTFKNGNITKGLTDPAKYNAWTEGKLVFRGDPMDEVARRIERWYNVQVVLGDKALEKYSFRATFEDDKLNDVLRFLSMTSPIGYRITPRKPQSDGTFEKEVVTFYLKK